MPVRAVLLLVALLALPYLVLAILTPPGAVYSGLLFTPSDGYLYLSQMLHGHLGAWRLVDYETWRTTRAAFLYTSYTLLGHLIPARTAGPVQVATAFHVARLVLAVGFVVQLRGLLKRCLPAPAARLGLILALFSSGAGVYQLLFRLLPGGSQPYDLKEIESSTFFSLLYAPHFAAVLLLLVVFLRGMLHLGDTGRRGWGGTFTSAVAAALVTTIHPEKALVLGLSAGLFAAWLAAQDPTLATVRRLAFRLSVLTLASALYPIYVLGLLRNDAVVAEVLRQAGAPPLTPLAYVAGFGVAGLAAAWGARRLRHPLRVGAGEALLWSFVGAQMVLLLLPSERLIHRGEGLQFALAALGGRALVMDILPRFWRGRAFRAVVATRPLGYSRRRLRELTVNLVVILASASVLALSISSPRAALAENQDIYLSSEDRAAVAWLLDHARASDVILGTVQSGEYLAAYSGTHTVVAHFEFTPYLADEIRDQAAFFASSTVDYRYLRQRHVTWLYFGPRERAIAAFSPGHDPGLRLAFRSGATSVYRVPGV
ncbi:MAG: hypothetical protein ACYDGR_01040 [Candidatus Dormibacteria bacterium]